MGGLTNTQSLSHAKSAASAPLSPLGGRKEKGPQVKICFLRFCEDLFVCLFIFVGTDVFISFQYAVSEKRRKVPFDLIVYYVVQQCQKTVPLLFFLRNNSLLLHANAMYYIYPLRKYYSPFREK